MDWASGSFCSEYDEPALLSIAATEGRIKEVPNTLERKVYVRKRHPFLNTGTTPPDSSIFFTHLAAWLRSVSAKRL
ncbi:hypothetical protein SDC9_98290 [bioreactor metagenome]|uniref:Uncharacterized protein n=1 Tax=bioreactor metagenome TaxID=1076179 RepID=A0A645AGX7_9ZZZZ